MAPQRNPLGLINSLVDQINTFKTAFESMEEQGDPTRKPHKLINDHDLDLLERHIKDLNGTLVRLTGQLK